MPGELPCLDSEQQPFPELDTALKDPNGLLAFGGVLSQTRLLDAYRRGIFPWFNSDDSHILWWSPNPRAVLYPKQIHVSKSLGKLYRKNKYHFSFDKQFEQVVHCCAQSREPDSGTWITQQMKDAYSALHYDGYAHSIEVWNREGSLVGGMYGLSLGRMFFGESMFSFEANTSKLAMYALAQQLLQLDFICLDCQMMTPHLASMGAVDISRGRFLNLLMLSRKTADLRGNWSHYPLDAL